MNAATKQIQRIRGDGIAILRTFMQGVPAEEGLRLADGSNRAVVSNKRWDGALVGSTEWQQPTVRPALPAWTGTKTAYVEPNTSFEKASFMINDNELEKAAGTRHFIEYIDPRTGERHLFPVPEEHLGKKNAILVAEHPGHKTILEGKDRVMVPAEGLKLAQVVDLAPNFPATNGEWYLADTKHGVPSGNIVGCGNPDARRLWRTDKQVGFVARGDGNLGYDGGRGVYLDGPQSIRYGVAVEKTGEGGAPLEISIYKN